MTPEKWQGVKRLFTAALDLPAKDRRAFLDHAYVGQPEMRTPVEELLAAQAQAGSFLDHPIVGDYSVAEVAISESKKDAAADSLAQGFTPGTVLLQRYRIVGALGRGGMGEVYRADDLVLGHPVALKFLPREFSNSLRAVERFRAEVRNARQMSHPNLCRVYDIGEAEGLQFLTMEYVDGEDLGSLLRRIGRLSAEKALQIAHQICSGLAAAHARGVLHRDLKPSNIMLDGRGIVRVTDFGLAVRSEDSNREIVGTPAYMAPEQFAGQPATVRSDIYALGLVLYEMYTGRRPFEAQGFIDWKQRHSDQSPTPPSSQSAGIDPGVERSILRCLEKEPSQRPSSALSVSAALPGSDLLAAALATGETPSPEMIAIAGPEGTLRAPVAWALLGATLALIAVSTFVLSRYATDWGLTSMEKSPEVLADRTHGLAEKLGYTASIDRDFWVQSDADYIHYSVARERTNGRQRVARSTGPDPINFWYRQSPQWMTPAPLHIYGPGMVTVEDPPHEVSGMVTLKLDIHGRLLFLRAVPPQIEAFGPRSEPDWNSLFSEAGLDPNRFSYARARWTPPEAFDQRADWEGTTAERPDLPLHIAAAAYHGVPVYFQVIAPWDQPWRVSSADTAGLIPSLASTANAALLVVYLCVAGFFARRNIRRGRGDLKGAIRIAIFVYLGVVLWFVLSFHLVPQPDYVIVQIVLALGGPLYFGLLVWIGYIAAEPYTRRRWPLLFVSWQRLLHGHFSDPLVARDILLGGFMGAVSATVALGVTALLGPSGLARTTPAFVDSSFGRGFWASMANIMFWASSNCSRSLVYFVLLFILTGILRRQWLGLTVTAIILVMLQSPSDLAVDLPIAIGSVGLFLAALSRVGLVGAVSFLTFEQLLVSFPPLDFTQWYAGRALCAILIPVALLVYGAYFSLSGRRIFGTA